MKTKLFYLFLSVVALSLIGCSPEPLPEPSPQATAEGEDASSTRASLFNGGTISPSVQYMYSMGIRTFSSDSPASCGTCPITYQWQSRDFNAATWTNIAGATGLSYRLPAWPSTAMVFRRQATSGSDEIAYSNEANVVYHLGTPVLSIIYDYGESVMVGVTSTIPAGAKFSWTMNGSPISWTNSSIIIPAGGGNTTTLQCKIFFTDWWESDWSDTYTVSGL